MNTDRSINELLELFGKPNISSLGSDIIVEYFDDLSVKEVMKLCRVNRQFNEACKKESMWKRKVENDYGIEKKYGLTWKETAKLLYDADMINLNTKWNDEKSYKDLFCEALESKSDDYFNKLFKKHKLYKIVFPPYVEEIEEAKEFIIDALYSTIGEARLGRKKARQRKREDHYKQFDVQFPEIMENLEHQTHLMTGELATIALAVIEIRGNLQRTYSRSYRFGLSTLANIHNSLEGLNPNPVFIKASVDQIRLSNMTAKLVDPELYIMTYSIMSYKTLTILSVYFL